MKIITGARQTGKTTELIKIAHKTYSRILCSSMLHCNLIQEIANKLELNIKPPITIKQFIKNPYKFRKENIAIDEVLHCFFQTLPIFDVTCITLGIEENQEFQLNPRKNYSDTHCSHYVLGECSQEHHNNCVGTNQCIKDLEQQLQRKKQECEELKHNYNTIKQCNENNIQTLEKAIQEKHEVEQKLEKVKKQYKCYSCGTCNGKEDYYNLAGHHKNTIKSLHKERKRLDHYKQALEKIEKILNPTEVCKDCRENYYNQHCEECTTHEIVNIINEIKTFN